MNKREAKKRWKIFSTKIAGNYFPVEKVFHRADEFSLNERFFFKEPKVEQNPEFWHQESPKYFDDDFDSNKCAKSPHFPQKSLLKKIDFLNKSLGLSLEIQMKLNISLKKPQNFYL